MLCRVQIPMVYTVGSYHSKRLCYEGGEIKWLVNHFQYWSRPPPTSTTPTVFHVPLHRNAPLSVFWEQICNARITLNKWITSSVSKWAVLLTLRIKEGQPRKRGVTELRALGSEVSLLSSVPALWLTCSMTMGKVHVTSLTSAFALAKWA